MYNVLFSVINIHSHAFSQKASMTLKTADLTLLSKPKGSTAIPKGTEAKAALAGFECGVSISVC